MGKLYSPAELEGKHFLSELRSSTFVITVGDRVTESMQRLGRTPDVQVIDEVERRVRRQAPDVPFVRLLKAINPPGTITFEAAAAVDAAIAGEKPARVTIEGEEDLLVLPAIVSAPMGATLYYGQPGKGVVLVTADQRTKSSAELIMSGMKREKS